MKQKLKKERPVIILAMNQELTTDAHLRRKFANATDRARRQAIRYRDFDLVEMEHKVHENLLASQLRIDDEYLGLLDLINRTRNNGNSVDITPGNVKDYFSLANTVTLNGIFLFNYLKKFGFQPEIVQNWASERNLFESLLQKNPLAVIVSSTYLSMDTIREIGLWVKERSSNVPIIAGGPLVNKILGNTPSLAEPTKKWLSGFLGAVDCFVIESQGEKTLVKILDRFAQGLSIDDIENLALPDNKGWGFTTRIEEPVGMDEGAVAWDEIPVEYLRPTVPINTSRGCIFKCKFCTYRKLVKGIHYKSLDCLRAEFESLKRTSGIRHVRFTDDNFTASAKRLKAICHMLIELGVPFTWTSFARPDSITRETARLMRRAGCVLLEMGLESGSPQILRNMDKRTSLDTVKATINILNREGIGASGAFIVGYPGETDETIQETVDLINQTGLPYYRLNFFAFSKGMLLYQERQEYNLSGLGFAWKHDTMDAARASSYIGPMIQQIPHGVSDGLSSTWETFKLLSGIGLEPEQIFSLFQESNKINRIRLRNKSGNQQWWKNNENWWRSFESLVSAYIGD